MNRDLARKLRQVMLIVFLSVLGSSIALGFFTGHWILSVGILINFVIFFLVEFYSVKKYGATISTLMTRSVEQGGTKAFLSLLQGITLAASFIFLCLHFYITGK